MNAEQEIRELKLRVQELEDRVKKLEDGEFGTGIYLDGCTEADKAYITGTVEPSLDKKAGE